ncbi:ATP-binding protein [Sediminibacterium sp.]|uniref:ATP-binding protein n=1 Tax=Sediminibacterium sp. TaxID=1917865 RepID=UPI003F70930E
MRVLLLLYSFFLVCPLIAQKNSGSSFIVDSLNKAAFDAKRSDISKALNLLIIAQNTAKQIDYKKGQAVAYMYEGGIFLQQGFVKRALSDFYLSLDIFKRTKDTFNIAKVSQQIASSMVLETKYDSASSIYNDCLAVFNKYNKQEEVVNIKNSLGLIQLYRNKPDSAVILFNQALNTSKEINYTYGEKKALYHLGKLAFDGKNFELATSFFYASMSIDRKLNDRYGLALNNLELANIAFKRGQLDSAFAMSKASYVFAKSIGAHELMDHSVRQIIQYYKKTNSLVNAMAWQDTAILINQLHRKKENEYAANFIDIIKNQQSLRLDRENAFLRAQRASDEQLFILTVGTFILIILAVLVVMVFINYQKQKHFSRELRAKNILIEAQIEEMGTLNKEISYQNRMLEADNKTKDKLLSIISHDLRNPLVNTKGILNLVNQEMVPEDQAKQLLLQLETQYMGTTSLLDNLLFWLKGQMSGKNLDRSVIVVYQLVKGLEEEHKMLFSRKNIIFSNNLHPQMFINADKEMIRIVLRNLISNAIKFTPENGTIEVHASQNNTHAIICVEDSGIGMTKETIEKINAKQYYTTAGTSMEKGSGFGLMLCSDLINRHDGTLTIESIPNKGSKFIIQLPLQIT